MRTIQQRLLPSVTESKRVAIVGNAFFLHSHRTSLDAFQVLALQVSQLQNL